MATKRNTEAARRRYWASRGYRIPLDRPDRPARYYVRYLRENGVIDTRTFVLEHAARKFADRLEGYGKQYVEIWEDTTVRRRWARLR
ncbi:hypothetical protein ABT348_24155 [Streptomyces olivaceus]|uniref:hypothetical protein n=1 Tax=Streptomyces olivaceus TaxID=47716 RepID=UPI00332A6124